MPISNQELVKKTISAMDALATNGKLNDAQAMRFIDYVIDETSLKGNVRIVRFRNENMDINKVGIGTRVAVPKNEARDPGVRRGVTMSKITLTPSALMVPFEITEEFKELNLEGDNFEDHAIRMFATQFANDMEELYINGDKNGPAVLESDIIDNGSSTQYINDSFLALQDGWSLLADSGNVYDADATNIGFSVFSNAIKSMPTKFRRNKKMLRWFMSPDLVQTYAEKMTTRATGAGDAAGSGAVMNPFGIQIVEVPLWDFNAKVVEHVTLNGTTAVSLKHKNITSVIVLPETLADTPTTPYVVTTDYTLDATAGTIARAGGGSIGDGDTVKVTYLAAPQMLLTHMQNFIVAIGRDIRIERDRDIYKSVDQYAITAKVGCGIEESTAIVKIKNIGEGV